MPGSATSLGSLSSPSPSLSPPPAGSAGQPEIASNGLGTDSELSELTEEEQEAEKQKRKRPKTTRRSLNHTRRSARGGASARGRGRKRGTLVPPAMWEWVPKPSEEEEEEEEASGPPRAMEEEEEDDGSRTPRSSAHHRSNHHPTVHDDDDGEPDGDGGSPPRDTNHVSSGGGENDAAESGEEEVADGLRPIRRLIRRPLPQSKRSERGDESSGTEDDEDDANATRKRPADEEGVEEDDAAMSDQQDDAADVESEDEDTEPEAEPAKTASVDRDGPPSHDASKVSATPHVNGDMDIDATTPTNESGGPVVDDPPANPPASTVAVNATEDSPQSPSPSHSGANTPASSRSPSPTPPPPTRSPPREAQETNKASTTQEAKPLQNGIKEGTESTLPTATTTTKHVPPPLDLSKVHASTAEPDAEPDIDVDADPDPDRSAEDIDVDDVSPDNDLEAELESDLQPAHRAEALDVLARIELKFSLLRERLYVEKMETLAWEESLVMESTHPELIHLQTELSNRRDKRLELASRRQEYEITHVTKRRKLDEDATWSWWKVARDELQIDMISETNRRRRQLERDRKALERPQPIRRIPQYPQEVPPPPTLRQIAKTFPHTQRRDKNGTAFTGPLYYPEVTSLTPAEVSSDIEMIYQHRRAVHVLSDSQIVYHAAYDQTNDGPAMSSFTNRMPPTASLQHPVTLISPQNHPTIPGSEPGPSRDPHVQHPLGYINGQDVSGHSQQLPIHNSIYGTNGDYLGQTNRRSISPVHLLPNGSTKQNGTWGTAANVSSDWPGDASRREMPIGEDEERMRIRRERDKRDKDRDRERDQEMERKDHAASYPHQGGPIRHAASHPPHQHVHAHPNQLPHHHNGPHHHHHHHHHFHHHHHSHNQPSSHPSIPPASSDVSPTHPPTRDYDTPRPQSGPPHAPEIINLTSNKPPLSHWKSDDPLEYRDGRPKSSHPGPSQPDERERPLATPFVLSSSHTIHQNHPTMNPANGTHSPRGAWNDEANLRLPPPSGTSPLGYQDGHPHSPGPSRYSSLSTLPNRVPPPPPQGLNKPGSLGLSPPRTRAIPQSPPPLHPNNSIHSPPRFGPQPSRLSPNLKLPHTSSPSLPTSKSLPAAAGGNIGSSNSTIYSPRLAGPGRTSTPTGLNTTADKHTSGASNMFSGSSRTASPLTAGLPYQSPSSHSGIPPLPSRSLNNVNGILGDRDRDREREREKEREWDRERDHRIPPPRSPMLSAPTKMKVAQIVDGH
ncbi:hypothetical protein ONZ45_g2669 [Pleurotus djamor]|nr:hypothetical protein ONZ45_g2669 [Pleurotus djamor]